MGVGNDAFPLRCGNGYDRLGSVNGQARVTLKRTSAQDFSVLRQLFDHPSFFGWGGEGRLSDDQIRLKYLGLRHPEVECFLVLDGCRPLGLAQLHVAADDEGGGMDLILLPEAHGHGFGRAVVVEMVRRARDERGWSRLTVDPDIANDRGLKFWRAVGFEFERTVTDESGRAPYVLMAWPGLADARCSVARSPREPLRVKVGGQPSR